MEIEWKGQEELDALGMEGDIDPNTGEYFNYHEEFEDRDNSEDLIENDYVFIDLNELKKGDSARGVLFIKSQEIRLKKNKDKYLLLTLTDGKKEIIMNDWNSTKLIPQPTNAIQIIRATIGEFAGRIQVENAEYIGVEADMSEVETAVNLKQEKEKLLNYFNLIESPKLKELVTKILFPDRENSQFFTTPGAKSNHHAYRHGLLQHTNEVIGLSLAMGGVYPQLNTDLLVVGAMLHDCGKMDIYELDGFEIEYNEVNGIQEHLYLGCLKVEEVSKEIGLDNGIKNLIINIIASHHSKLEWASLALPATAEAMVVAKADLLSSELTKLYNNEPNEHGLVQVRYDSYFKKAYTPETVKDIMMCRTNITSQR